MKALFDWLDHRTGVRKLTHEALYENVPGGARWRYVWGSTLTFTFAIQVITGLVLWMAYSPSSQTAWASVYFIQNEMLGGWFLRGLHHYTAQAMNILLVLHLMQVVIDGAYKAPREMNFWMGMGLLALVLALSLTGYLLPWDQKGFWATKVATNIAGITPFIGAEVQKLVIGGVDYGHHTLTRFFALHAGVIPGAIVALIVGHIYLFRRHGLTAKLPKKKPDAPFWPDQVLTDAVACLAVMAAVLFLTLKTHGAPLGAPADPSEPFSAARPEWYFLFLFQFLKYFPGGTELIGAIIIPTGLFLVVMAMPFIGNWKLGHRFNLGFLCVMLGGAGFLTYLAWNQDHHDPSYLASVQQADRDAERVRNLAMGQGGIPESGPVALLRNDPLTQGPKIFAKSCASCHRYDGLDGNGLAIKDAPAASDLKGFASRAWLTGLLDSEKVVTAHYFGGTKFKDGKMSKFVRGTVAKFTPDQKDKLQKILSAVSAEAGLKAQKSLDEKDVAMIAQGRELIRTEEMRCTECHQFQKKDDDATAPDLTGYGSRDWLIGMISNPKHERYYGDRNDRMPAFGADQVLDATAIGLVADWLRGEWYEPAVATGKQP